jgi:hypothetical protein
LAAVSIIGKEHRAERSALHERRQLDEPGVLAMQR